MFSLRMRHPLMLVMALLVMATAFATNAQIAEAKCCLVRVDNQSSCSVEAVLVTTSWRKAIKLPPGKSVFDITCGDDWELWFNDLCSPWADAYRKFPYEWSFDIRVSPTCCINVTGVPLEPCTVVITDARCPC